MNFFILIFQFLLYIHLNSNKKTSVVASKSSKQKYPSNWNIPNINYYIDSSLNKTPIEKALEKIQKQTCLRFNPMNETNLNNDIEGLKFVSNSMCATYFGNIDESTLHTIRIGKNCSGENDVGKIQQLIGKALGMVDQHRRPDRDNYISINYTGINKTMWEPYLEKWNSSMMHLYGIGYDYNSLFHWKSNVFRLPNDTTFTLNAKISQYNEMMGQLIEFNFADYKLLNYHLCNSSYTKMHETIPNCMNSGYYDINNDKKGMCKCPNGFSGQHCGELKSSDTKCQNSKDISATSLNQTLSESGKKNCTFRIKTSDGKKVLVTISNVNTQAPTEGQKCMPETGFEIKHRNDKSPAGLCLCGSHSSITLTSEGNEVIVLYTGRDENDSFNLTYSETNNMKTD
uniref:Metalloendopeptidase n=1 Tax=Strongyloides venezuelensis TaxID=75913 RepID=A0A0K0FSM5_STRVS